MLRRNLGPISSTSHVNAGRAVALRNILDAPVALAFASHVDAAGRAAIRWRMRQLRSTWIADAEDVTGLFLLLVVFHVSLLFCRCNATGVVASAVPAIPGRICPRIGHPR